MRYEGGLWLIEHIRFERFWGGGKNNEVGEGGICAGFYDW